MGALVLSLGVHYFCQRRALSNEIMNFYNDSQVLANPVDFCLCAACFDFVERGGLCMHRVLL
jgi:hypothetical protein